MTPLQDCERPPPSFLTPEPASTAAQRLGARYNDPMTALEPIHPGEHLAEMLQELGITQYRLAKTMGVPQIRVHQIVHGRRAVTPDSALRLGRALGMTPDFWLNLQRMYDLDVARAKTDVSAIRPLVQASPDATPAIPDSP